MKTPIKNTATPQEPQGDGCMARLVGRLVQAGTLKDSEGNDVCGLLIDCGESVLRNTPLPLYRDVEVVAYEPCRPWHSIESAPRDEYALFWIVPLGSDDCCTDSSGNPIRIDFEPHITLNKYGRWSALSKATHWMPLPIPPNAGDQGSAPCTNANNQERQPNEN